MEDALPAPIEKVEVEKVERDIIALAGTYAAALKMKISDGAERETDDNAHY